MQRREFIAYGGTAFVSTTAGCLSNENTGNDDTDRKDSAENRNSSNLSDHLNTFEAPDPVVTDLRYPEARGVSTNDQYLGPDSHEFSVTVENTGTSGDIEITVVLLMGMSLSVWSPLAKEVGTYQRYFSAGERRTESFSAEWDDLYNAYGFRLTPAEAETDVRNDGAEGEVEVRLLQRDDAGNVTVIGREKAKFAEDATRTVRFNVDTEVSSEFEMDDIYFDADASSVGWWSPESDEE
ncbi:hypothetical protein [Natrinema sp. H-ect4]|uniref:hypothetical protein n=1 Tax=Natrinema sp. H-ect4 TaxID=3242699 RepID=UPI0035A99FE8